MLLPTVYEDAGISGGTLERPGLQRLLADIDADLVEQVVVYKVDRLTRSLSDFAKPVERLEAAGAVFISVTESFNTATSMGRLTLHMLLSFAQFEREVTAERIRDKVAASKRKGLWMGGHVPLGYEQDGRTLRINEAEAETVRTLYALSSCAKTRPFCNRPQISSLDALGIRAESRVFRAAGRASDPWAAGGGRQAHWGTHGWLAQIGCRTSCRPRTAHPRKRPLDWTLRRKRANVR